MVCLPFSHAVPRFLSPDVANLMGRRGEPRPASASIAGWPSGWILGPAGGMAGTPWFGKFMLLCATHAGGYVISSHLQAVTYSSFLCVCQYYYVLRAHEIFRDTRTDINRYRSEPRRPWRHFDMKASRRPNGSTFSVVVIMLTIPSSHPAIVYYRSAQPNHR